MAIRNILKRHWSEVEISFAISGAIGLIAMLLFPAWGLLLVDAALILLALLYLVLGLIGRRDYKDNRFQAVIDRINLLVAAVAAVMLIIIFNIQNDILILSSLTLGLLFTCFAMNVLHRYLYKIEDPGHVPGQIRLILLSGLVLIQLILHHRLY